MKLEQLQYFAEAVKHRSISVAAEKNFISQPTFSASISKLENELGVELLRRSNRGVTPTETGVLILERVQAIDGLLDDILTTAKTHAGQGSVKLATIPCMCDRILPLVLNQLKRQDASFTLSITSAESQEVYHSVLSGMAAIGIVFGHEELPSSEILYTDLFEDSYVLYVGPKSPYWQVDSITIDEVFAQPYIAYRQEFIKYNGGISDFFKGRIPKIAVRTDELEAIKILISETDGVAFFHRVMTKDDLYLQSGRIRALPISDCDTCTRVGYIESTRYKPSYIDRLFIDVLKEVTKTLEADSICPV